MGWIVVTQSSCEWCEKAKKLLSDNDISFTVVPVDDQGGTQLRRFLAAQGHTTLPQIWDEDGVHVGGYTELEGEFIIDAHFEGYVKGLSRFSEKQVVYAVVFDSYDHFIISVHKTREGAQKRLKELDGDGILGYHKIETWEVGD
jgi:glutaredoxin